MPVANERTYLSWLAMATTLGSVGTAIAGFVYKDPSGKEKGIISKGTVELITMTTLPISIAMIAYALYTFWKRSEYIRKKQVGGRPWLSRRAQTLAAGRLTAARVSGP